MILPPPRRLPVAVELQVISMNKHESFGTSGKPRVAQSACSILFDSGKDNTVRTRVAVMPKFPAVKVEAAKVTELTDLINRSEERRVGKEC